MPQLSLFRGIAEHAPNAMLLVDAAGRIVFSNIRAGALLGYSAQELAGAEVEVLIPENIRLHHQRVREQYGKDPIANPMRPLRELTARQRDGRTLPVEVFLAPVDIEGGSYVVATLIDLSARRRMEGRMRLLDAAVTCAAEGIVITDSAPEPAVGRRIVYANPAFYAMCGYPPGDIIGHSPRLLQGAKTDPSAVRQISAALLADQALSLDILNYRKDGAEYWAHLTVSPVKDSSGKVSNHVAVMRDVTGDRHTAQRIETQARLLAQVQTVARVGGWEFDVAANRVTWTHELSHFLDFEHEERSLTYGESMRIYTGDSLRRILAARRSALRRSLPYDIELQAVTARGRTLWVRETCEAVVVDGRVARLIGAVRDVTERRTLEAAILKIANDEQHRLGMELHDGLGQELTGLSLLMQGVANRAKAVDPALSTDLANLAALAGKAVDTARAIAHGLAPFDWERGGLRGALRRLADEISAAHNIDVVCRVQGLAPRYPDESASAHLYRIAQEAVANAIKHGRATRIAISLRGRTHQVRLTVTDNGMGIGAGSKDDGMGLHLMRYRARLLGGEMTISAARGGGTQVTCTCGLVLDAATERRNLQARQADEVRQTH